MNAFFRLKNGSTKGSLGRVHIVDDKMEVKRNMRVEGVARPLVLQLRFPKAVDNQAGPKYAFERKLRPTHGLSSLQNHFCQVDVAFVRPAWMRVRLPVSKHL